MPLPERGSAVSIPLHDQPAGKCTARDVELAHAKGRPTLRRENMGRAAGSLPSRLAHTGVHPAGDHAGPFLSRSGAVW